MREFIPPIRERSTKDLLRIAGKPLDWEPEAVILAENELRARKVPQKDIKFAGYIAGRTERLEELKLAKESFTFWSFLEKPIFTILSILFYFGYKKDGRFRKAEQQTFLRPILIAIILLLWITGEIFLE